MGCNQSRERAEPKAECSKPEVNPSPAATTSVVAEPVQQQQLIAPEPEVQEHDSSAPSMTPLMAQSEPIADSVSNLPDPEPQVAPAPIPEAAPAPTPEAAPIIEASAAAPEASNDDIVASTTIPETSAAEPLSETVAVEGTSAAVEEKQAIPALLLAKVNPTSRKSAPKTPKRAKTPSRTVTPRKENGMMGKTPSKTPSKTPKRALGDSVTNGTNKKVGFESVPPPVDNASRRKEKAKKTAGRHACNLQEEMFLASVAAFERQLTHRASLDAQLNTR